MMPKTLLLVAAMLMATPALAQPAKRPPDCSQRFLAMWLNNRDEAFQHMPKQPCTLYGETGIYVCDKTGCRRP